MSVNDAIVRDNATVKPINGVLTTLTPGNVYVNYVDQTENEASG